MILCRPSRRSDYLLGRFAGILAAYAVFLLAALGLALLFSRALPLLGAPPQPLALPSLARGAAGSMLTAIGIAAPILLLSTFLPGYGDVLGYILLTPLLSLPSLAAQILKAPALEKAGALLRQNLLPSARRAYRPMAARGRGGNPSRRRPVQPPGVRVWTGLTPGRPPPSSPSRGCRRCCSGCWPPPSYSES
jgi:hypothetical protein